MRCSALARESLIHITEVERIVSLTVAAPVQPGPQSERLAWRIADICAEMNQRDDQPVAVVLWSEGPAFCVRAPGSGADCDAAGPSWGHATAALASLGPPSIAAIQSDAIGPAWELALACDLRIATPEARLGSPEILWGRMPAAGGTQRILRLIRLGLALRMLLLGELVSGATALDYGLVSRIAPVHRFDLAVDELLAQIRAAAPIALSYAKEAVVKGAELPLEDGLRLEADLSALLHTTADRQEGIQAFMDRRQPRFTGL